MMILGIFLGVFTYLCANTLILSRTTSIPRSSDALSSIQHSLILSSPSICLAIHKMLVVLPVPGGPVMMRFGKFPLSAITLSYMIIWSCPTTSSNFLGRYFSMRGRSCIMNYNMAHNLLRKKFICLYYMDIVTISDILVCIEMKIEER